MRTRDHYLGPLIVVLTLAPALSAAQTYVGTYSTASTSSATYLPNVVTWALGEFPAGTTIRVGTCAASGDLPWATASGDTFLRLWGSGPPSAPPIELAVNDDAGDMNTPECGRGSYISYTTPFRMNLSVRAGCYGSSVCSGSVYKRWDLDANGSLTNIGDAFDALQNFYYGSGYGGSPTFIVMKVR